MLQQASLPGTVTAPRAIRDGDLVIVYVSHEERKPVIVKQGLRTQVRYGVFSHDDWVGVSFGSKVYSKSGSWVYLLAPTCELWTESLSHRTQILYTSDCAQICSGLDLRSGSVVRYTSTALLRPLVSFTPATGLGHCSPQGADSSKLVYTSQVLESGTGSGSLTHSLARAVAPAGAVHTFEFHKQRCEEAAAEFKQNGIADIVHSNHRNIEALGFPGSCHGIADGIILDLPAPWKVVESAKACLKMNGKFCGFSPCIEQVQRTADALREAEFCDVRCIECILHYHDVRTENYALPAASTQAPSATAAPVSTTLKRTAAEAGVEGDDLIAAVDGDAQEGGALPERSNGQDGATAGGQRPAGGKKGEVKGRVKERRLGRHCAPYVPWMSEHGSVRRTVTMPRHVARGHTGYLLFARKPVKVEDEDDSEMDAEEEGAATVQGKDGEGSADAKKAVPE